MIGNLFIAIYNFFRRHVAVFIFLFVALLAFEGYSLSRIHFSENITDFLPKSESADGFSDVIHNSNFADDVILYFTLKDSTQVAPDSLIQAASIVVDSLSKDTLNIKNIRFRVDDQTKLSTYQFFYDHLALYLDEAKYETIRQKLRVGSLNDTFAKNLQSLISPSGMVTKRFILQDPLSLTPLVIDRLKKFNAGSHYQMYKSCVFSRDQKYLFVFIKPNFSASNLDKDRILIAEINALKKQVQQKYSAIDICSYGAPVVTLDNAQRVKKDIYLTISIALVLLITMFFFVFRRIRVFVLLFLPVILGAGLSMSLLSYIYPAISFIVLGVGAMLIGVAIDYSLHFFTHFRSSTDLEATFRDVSEPILISSLTTAASFLCLFVVQSDVLTQLGIFVAFTVLLTVLFVLIFIPQFLHFVQLGKNELKGYTLFDQIASLDFSKKKALYYAVLVMTVVFFFSSKNLGFNGNLTSLNYMTPKVRHSEAVLKSVSPDVFSAVSIVASGHTLDEVLENSEKIRPIVEELKREGKVKSFISVTDIMLPKAMQEAKIKQWQNFWATINHDSLCHDFLTIGKKYHFKEKTFASFFQKIKEPVADTDFRSMRKLLLDNYISRAADGSYRIFSVVRMDAKDKGALFDGVQHIQNIHIFDKAYYTNQFFKILKNNFNLLVLVSSLLVFLILWVALGRIELAVITYLPILISWLWTIGMMGLFGIQFNIFSVIITTFIFGLGIDYSIFLIRGLLTNYKYGTTSIVPYRLSILLSVCTTVGGVGVLILAKHPALQSIALVSIFGISSVVLVTFILLPRLFSFLMFSEGKKRTSPIVMLDLLVSLGSFMVFLISVIIFTLFLPLLILFPIAKKRKKELFSYLLCLFCKVIVRMNFTTQINYIDRFKLDLTSPKVMVANHQSHLDLALLLMLHPKIIVLTNKWVWNNPFYGIIVRYADFYSVANGVDNGIDQIKAKVKEGYSVLVFPEGTRTIDGTIHRFHQGAFKLAVTLELPIQPVLIHGAYECLPKTEFFLHSGNITLKFFDAIDVEVKDKEGESYRHQAKQLTQFYRQEMAQLNSGFPDQLFDTHYYRRALISKYIYKGPVLEWYLRVKIHLEKDYEQFDRLVPKRGKIVDLGCGYGFLSLMLKMTSPERDILGIDYDEVKIRVANHIAKDYDGLSFQVGDVVAFEQVAVDVFILSDVLHYLPFNLQRTLLQRCIDSLTPDGMIIIRDANADYVKRTKGTKLTEVFSTKILSFNKTNYSLEFTSTSKIKKLAQENGLDVTVIDETKYTSNTIYQLRRRND